MFRRVLRGRVVVIIVVYVNDLLVASETKRGKEGFVVSLMTTPWNDGRSGAGTILTPHRLQRSLLKLDSSLLYHCNADRV